MQIWKEVFWFLVLDFFEAGSHHPTPFWKDFNKSGMYTSNQFPSCFSPKFKQLKKKVQRKEKSRENHSQCHLHTKDIQNLYT
jgi:hypothetical protein